MDTLSDTPFKFTRSWISSPEVSPAHQQERKLTTL